jgi:hypothetical protein
MKKRPVNLGRSDENIADQYPNIFDGLQKDAAQNSWDARATKKGKDWKLIFKYLHDRHILIIEDFGTTGMNDEKWNSYQSLWDTTKAIEDTLGARGQGKFLFHYFSTDKLVLTESIDENGQYWFSYGTTEGYEDEESKLEDYIPGARKLDHQGTRIWIMNVKPELREELLDYRTFMKYISATWWEIIRNYGVVFIVNFDGIDRQVSIPEFPPSLKERSFPNEPIKNIGKIRYLVLQYCGQDIPEEFHGIAIQRGGMTVLRIPVIAEESIKNRLYGYCDFDDALEMELKKCELPNHFGFTNKKAWNHVRDHIRRHLDEFLLKITPKKEKIEVASEVLQKAVRLVNDLIGEYVPELLSGPDKPPTPQPPPKPLSPIRIDVFRPSQRKFEYNETLKIQCEVTNETNDEKELMLRVNIEHNMMGTEKHKSRFDLKIPQQSRKKIDIPLIDFDVNQDNPGKYSSRGLLESRKEKIDEKGFSFYLHEEPPVPPPDSGKGKMFISNFEFLKGKKTDGTMQTFAKWRNLPIETSRKSVLYVVWDHSDFVRTRQLTDTKKEKNRAILLYCAQCSINEAFRKLLEHRYSDRKLDPDEIRRIKNMCDEMIYEAVTRTE